MSAATKTETSEAVLFRDADYGALSLELVRGGIVTTNNGFMQEDARVVFAALGRYAESSPRSDGSTMWRVVESAHPAAVLSTVQAAMRECGYKRDPLAERAIIMTDTKTARRPDLPATGACLVHEAVERGVRQQLQLVVTALRENGPTSVPSIKYFPRPNAAQSSSGRRPPFAVARFFTESNDDTSVTRSRVLEALRPWEGALVKVAVTEGDGQEQAVEVGLALRPSDCEAFLESSVPSFRHSEMTGARRVELHLRHPLTEDERRDIEELGRVCTGVIQLAQEGNVVVAQVPAGFIGHHVSDRVLGERLDWLMNTLDPWEPTLNGIGGLEEMNLAPASQHGELVEALRLGKIDKQVINAFTDKKPMLGYKLDTDGKTLDGSWMGGRGIAVWKGDKIHFADLGSKSAQTVQNAVKKMAPRNDIAESINEEEDGGYEVADYGLPPEVNTLLTQFAAVKQHLWDTPQVKGAVRKAKKLVADKHGKDVEKEFDTKLDIARATACESVNEAYKMDRKEKRKLSRALQKEMKPTYFRTEGTVLGAISDALDVVGYEPDTVFSADVFSGLRPGETRDRTIRIAKKTPGDPFSPQAVTNNSVFVQMHKMEPSGRIEATAYMTESMDEARYPMTPAAKYIIDNPTRVDWAEDAQLTYALRAISQPGVGGSRKMGAAAAGISNELRSRGYSMREIASIQDESMDEVAALLARGAAVAGKAAAKVAGKAAGAAAKSAGGVARKVGQKAGRAVAGGVKRAGQAVVKKAGAAVSKTARGAAKSAVAGAAAGAAATALSQAKKKNEGIGSAVKAQAAKFKGKVLHGDKAGLSKRYNRGQKRRHIEAGNNTIMHNTRMERNGPGGESGWYISAPYFDVRRLVRDGFTARGMGADEAGLPRWFIYERRGASRDVYESITEAEANASPLALAQLGRTMIQAAGTFKPAASAEMDGSDPETKEKDEPKEDDAKPKKPKNAKDGDGDDEEGEGKEAKGDDDGEKDESFRRRGSVQPVLTERDATIRELERQYAQSGAVADLHHLHRARVRARTVPMPRTGDVTTVSSAGKKVVKGLIVDALGINKQGSKWMVTHMGTGMGFGTLKTKEKAVFAAQELMMLPYAWQSFTDPDKMPLQQMRKHVMDVMAAAETWATGKKKPGKKKVVKLSEPANVIGKTQSGKEIIAELDPARLVSHTRSWSAQDLGDAYILASFYAKKRGKDDKTFPGGMFRNAEVGGFYKLDRIYGALLDRHPEKRELAATEYSSAPGLANVHFFQDGKRVYKHFFRGAKGKALYMRRYFSRSDAEARMTASDAMTMVMGR